MFNSKAKLKQSLKSYKFDMNLMINDKEQQESFSPALSGRQNGYSELCEKSILNNEGSLLGSSIDSNLQSLLFSTAKP